MNDLTAITQTPSASYALPTNPRDAKIWIACEDIHRNDPNALTLDAVAKKARIRREDVGLVLRQFKACLGIGYPKAVVSETMLARVTALTETVQADALAQHRVEHTAELHAKDAEIESKDERINTLLRQLSEGNKRIKQLEADVRKEQRAHAKTATKLSESESAGLIKDGQIKELREERNFHSASKEANSDA